MESLHLLTLAKPSKMSWKIVEVVSKSLRRPSTAHIERPGRVILLPKTFDSEVLFL
jgi:hypothetical protein